MKRHFNIISKVSHIYGLKTQQIYILLFEIVTGIKQNKQNYSLFQEMLFISKEEQLIPAGFNDTLIVYPVHKYEQRLGKTYMA